MEHICTDDNPAQVLDCDNLETAVFTDAEGDRLIVRPANPVDSGTRRVVSLTIDNGAPFSLTEVHIDPAHIPALLKVIQGAALVAETVNLTLGMPGELPSEPPFEIVKFGEYVRKDA